MQKWGIIKTVFSLGAFFRLWRSYLEPGSSSFLLKIIISGLVGVVLFLRHFWTRIRAIYQRFFGQNYILVPEAPDEEGDEF